MVLLPLVMLQKEKRILFFLGVKAWKFVIEPGPNRVTESEGGNPLDLHVTAYSHLGYSAMALNDTAGHESWGVP